MKLVARFRRGCIRDLFRAPSDSRHELGDRQKRRDIVARVGIVGGQEGVVEVQFAHRRAVGPSGPLPINPNFRAQAEERGPAGPGMGNGGLVFRLVL